MTTPAALRGGYGRRRGATKRTFLRMVRDHVELHRDASGIAWIVDTSAGIAHSAHPNIDATGSVRGMKQLGLGRKDARTVRSHGFIYNVSETAVETDLDEIARKACRCGGVHAPRKEVQP